MTTVKMYCNHTHDVIKGNKVVFSGTLTLCCYYVKRMPKKDGVVKIQPEVVSIHDETGNEIGQLCLACGTTGSIHLKAKRQAEKDAGYEY